MCLTVPQPQVLLINDSVLQVKGVTLADLSFQATCDQRGCCWRPQGTMRVPWCYYSKSHGYQVEGDLASTGTGRPDRVAGPPDPPFAAGESLRGMRS